jgi:5'-nucleotidase
MIEPGVLTKRDVLSTLPYNNKVVKVQLSGAVLREALEHGVASLGVEAQPGRFPQVSGIRFVFDTGRPPGKRITSITINGKPLEDSRTYTLATTSYVAIDAGDGYDMFRKGTLVIRPEQAPSETDILLKAIGRVPAIAPKTDGRITRVDAGKDKSSCN